MDELTGLNPDAAKPVPSAPPAADRLTENILAGSLDLQPWVDDLRPAAPRKLVLDASVKPLTFMERFGLKPYARWGRQLQGQLMGQQSIEVMLIQQLCQNDPAYFRWGWLSVPKAGDRWMGSQLELGGWVVGLVQAQPRQMQILLNDQPIATLPIATPRPDVIKQLFYEPAATHCGFQTVVDLSAHQGDLVIELRALFPDGICRSAAIAQLFKIGKTR